MIDWPEAILRLTSATLIGGAIGINREMHGKPIGVRTLSIVALGSALVVVASQHPAGTAPDAASRVIQGVITGIGFLGAGVILRGATGKKVHGLTTAAAIWMTACIGVACGLGAWPLVITAAVLVALILGFGRQIEHVFDPLDSHKSVHKHDAEKDEQAEPNGGGS